MAELFGKPIEGKINYHTSEPEEQRPDIEFVEKLDDLLAFPEVHSVRWEQYTPYFNDGEPCEFSTGEIYLKMIWDVSTSEEDEDEYEYADGYRDGYDLYDYKPGTSYPYDKENDMVWHFAHPDGVAFPELAKAWIAFTDSFGAHQVLLHKTFGDPAQVTADRNGYSVDFYDHD